MPRQTLENNKCSVLFLSNSDSSGAGPVGEGSEEDYEEGEFGYYEERATTGAEDA